jgi:hypothetical protein
MKRETKVGLVVAGSFLSLVGIVLASKLKQGENARAETLQADASAVPDSAGIKKQSGKKAKKHTSPETAHSPTPDISHRVMPTGDPAPVLNEPGEKDGKDTDPSHSGSEVKHDLEVIQEPVAAVVQPVARPKKKKKNRVDLPLTEPSIVSEDKTAKKRKKGESAEPKASAVIDDIIGRDKKEKETELKEPATIGSPEKKEVESAAATRSKTADKTEAVKRPAGMGKTERTIPKKESVTGDGCMKPSAEAHAVEPTGAARGVTTTGAESAVLAPARPSATLDKTIIGVKEPGASSGQESAHVKPAAATGDSKQPPKDFPLGKDPMVIAPAISVPPPAGGGSDSKPQAKDWSVEIHKVAQGDTFATISKKYFKDEKYEQALLKYNREYQSQDGLEKNPPDLPPGTQVQVPDLTALESLYPEAIPGFKKGETAPAPTGAPGPDDGKLRSATATTDMATTPVVQVATKKDSQPTRAYEVRKEGETYYAIAKKTLANPARWNEIYHLNGERFEASRPLPVGTLLRLPADAHVERTP